MAIDAHVVLETRRTDLPVIKEWIDNRDYGNAGKVLTAYLNENPTCDEGLFLYGRLMLEQDSAAISAIIYERLTAADKEQRWENYVNLGKAWDHLNEPYKAEYCYKKALEIDPDNQTALVALGTCYVQQYKSDEAIEICEKALALYPQARWAQSSLGFALLQKREWGLGWDAYEAGYGKLRWRNERNYRGEPRWQGKKSKSERVAVHAEQGIGDQIAGLEPLADMAKDCTVTSLEVSPKMLGLAKRSFPDLDVYGTLHQDQIEWPAKKQINAHAGLFSVHRHYRRRESDYKGEPYLIADPQRRVQWRALFDSMGPKAKVGIAWSGGVGFTQRTSRRAALEEWVRILRQDCDLISLEYKDRSADIEAIKRRRKIEIHDFPWATRTDDYDDTAAMVAELDLVITVPTAVVHLAGALGVPTLCMTHSRPNIHYCAVGDKIAYYGDTVRLFRREKDNDWSTSVGEVADALKQFLTDRNQQAKVA
jgi:tetratricopeptide (TPR) repeat protein